MSCAVLFFVCVLLLFYFVVVKLIYLFVCYNILEGFRVLYLLNFCEEILFFVYVLVFSIDSNICCKK